LPSDVRSEEDKGFTAGIFLKGRGGMMKKSFMLILSLGLILGMFTSPGYGDTIALTPVADFWVGSLTNPDNPGSDDMKLRVETSWDSVNDIHHPCRSYLQFDLSTIPTGSTITGASLTLNSYYAAGLVASYDLYHVADDTKIINSMTWNTQPVTGSGPLDSLQLSYLNQGVNTWNLLALGNWDSTSDLADHLVSLQLRISDEGVDSGGMVWFRSLNYGTDVPLLTIDYTNDPSPVPIPGAALLLGAGMVRLVIHMRKSRV
jgi:hypothetical protein